MANKNFRQLNKLVFINTGNCPYSEIELSGNTCFIGINGEGKSTTQRAILFFYNADGQKLGIPRNHPFKPFEEYYFPSPNSYIIYEVQTENGGAFHIITHRLNRLVYYFVEGPYRKEHFIRESIALGLTDVLASLRAQDPPVYVSRRIETFQEYREILYGATRKAELKPFYLIAGNSKYENVPRAITDIFLSSSSPIEADFIKNFIANAVSDAGTDINLEPIKRQVRQFREKLEDVDTFRQPGNQHLVRVIAEAHDQQENYKVAQGETAVQLGSTLKHARSKVAALQTEVEKADKLLVELEKEATENAANYSERQRELSELLGVIKEKITKAERLDREYRQKNAAELLQLHEGKAGLRADLTARQEEYKTLTASFQDIELQFSVLYNNLQNERTALDNELRGKGIEIDQQRRQQMEEIRGQFEEELKRVRAGADEQLSILNEQLDTLKESRIRLEGELLLVRRTVPFETELKTLKEQWQIGKQEVGTARNTMALNQKEGTSALEKVAFIEEKYRNLQANFQLQKSKEIDEVKRRLAAVREKLSVHGGAFYGFLETSYPGWRETIGKVCSEDLLFREDLQPALHAFSQTLYGIELNLGGVESKARSLEEYELLQTTLEAGIRELETAILDHRAQAESDLETELSALRKRISELNQQQAALEYAVQKGERELEEKALSISDWTSRSERERDRQIGQTLEKQQAVQQEVAALTNRVQARKEELKKQEQALQAIRTEKEKTLRVSFEATSAKLAEEKEEKVAALQERKGELDYQKKQALENKGVDSSRINKVKSELEALGNMLQRIEDNEELVIRYKKDREEYIGRLEEFREEQRQNTGQQEALKVGYETARKGLGARRREAEQRKAALTTEQKNYVEGLKYFEQQFSVKSHLSGVFREKIDAAPEAFVESSIMDLCFRLEGLQQEYMAKWQLLRESINKLAGTLRAENHFSFKVHNTNEFDYRSFAAHLRSFVAEDRLKTSISELGQEHWQILDAIGTKVADLMRQVDRVKRTIVNIDTELEKSNFSEGRLIQYIKIRFREGKSPALRQLQTIADLKNENEFGIGTLNLFQPTARQNNELHKKSVDALSKLFKILEEEGKDRIQLQDTFELQFNIREKKNETGWVERLPKVGSDGTDIMVKSIIYITLLNLFIKESTHKTAGHFRVHCIIDEVGKIATSYMKELLQFTGGRNILLVNGLPNESKLEMHYNATYKLRNGARDTMLLQKILTNTIEV
ncbi:ATP-binding protein [Paraflavisolibacter sp. H34]|uniref:ATP-binding protein n=1 Tax=Huijunlia imazamoxiresistens TaxID=3127457 RepID=UPI00301B6B92